MTIIAGKESSPVLGFALALMLAIGCSEDSDASGDQARGTGGDDTSDDDEEEQAATAREEARTPAEEAIVRAEEAPPPCTDYELGRVRIATADEIARGVQTVAGALHCEGVHEAMDDQALITESGVLFSETVAETEPLWRAVCPELDLGRASGPEVRFVLEVARGCGLLERFDVDEAAVVKNPPNKALFYALILMAQAKGAPEQSQFFAEVAEMLLTTEIPDTPFASRTGDATLPASGDVPGGLGGAAVGEPLKHGTEDAGEAEHASWIARFAGLRGMITARAGPSGRVQAVDFLLPEHSRRTGFFVEVTPY